MGIVNLSGDSFFSSSRTSRPSEALRRIDALLGEGADCIDIGAASSRPGSVNPGPEEEWKRLEPVLSDYREIQDDRKECDKQEAADGAHGVDIPISIDTIWSEVIRRATDLVGPLTVNDISAGAADPAMLPLAGSLGLRYIAMHMRGTSATMQTLTDYPEGVVRAVSSFFSAFARRARRFGIKNWVLDPGFGFAKTMQQNDELLRGMSVLCRHGRPLLVGVSRKSMIYKRFGISPEDSLPATQVVQLRALQEGADILRVHDVAEAARTVSLYRALSR